MANLRKFDRAIYTPCYGGGYTLEACYLTPKGSERWITIKERIGYNKGLDVAKSIGIHKNMIHIERRERSRDNTIIYFIRCQGFVKIGRTKMSAQSRLAAMQACAPYPMHIEYAYYGRQEHESATHDLFKAHRLNNEWFTYCDEISSYILKLKSTKRSAMPKERHHVL